MRPQHHDGVANVSSGPSTLGLVERSDQMLQSNRSQLRAQLDHSDFVLRALAAWKKRH